MRVICRDSILPRGPVRELCLPDGLTLHDAVARSGMPAEVWQYGVCIIGADRFDPPVWQRVRPKAGATVAIGIAAQGPGIAVASAAFSTIGKSALAVLGRDGPKVNKERKGPDIKESGVSGNTLRKGEQIPAVLGRMLVSPPKLAPEWTETTGPSSVTRAVFGLAGRYRVSGLRINGSETLPGGVSTAIRDGSPASADLSIFTSTAWMQDGRGLMERGIGKGKSQQSYLHGDSGDSNYDPDKVVSEDYPKERLFRLGDTPDRFWLDFNWPAGLSRTDPSITGSARQVGMAIQVWLYGEDGVTYKMPQFHAFQNNNAATRAKILFDWATDPGGLTAPGTSYIWRFAFAKTTAMDTKGTTANSYFGTSAAATHVGVDADETTLHVYLDSASIPKQRYSVGVKAGGAYLEDNLNFTTNQYTRISGGAATDAAHFDARTTGTPPTQDFFQIERQDEFATDLKLERVVSQWDETPLEVENLCTVEVESNNTQVDSVSFIAERYVAKTWDAASETWIAAPRISTNPAELAYDILTNATWNEHPVAETLIDASMGEWAEWCAANGKECNAVVSSGNVDDALALCYAAGHAIPLADGKYGAIIDKDRSADVPDLVFTPRNSRGFTVERLYEKLPHALLCTFDDEEDDYRTREIVVYAPGYTVDTATRFEGKEFTGFTIEHLVRKAATLDIRSRYYRLNRYSLETDARHMVTRKGRMVGVMNDVLTQVYGYAQIVDVYRNSANEITGIVVDAEINFEAGAGDIYSLTDIYAETDIYSIGTTFGVAITALDGTVVMATTGQTSPSRTIMFSAALAADADIVAGCDVAVGELDQEFRRLVVERIEPGPVGNEGATARLTFYDEAPEIFA